MHKQDSPVFPLWWLDESKRNISALPEIASHLHGKTAARGSNSGFTGDTTAMEKQIIEGLIDLRQQVYVLTDVVQATLQILAADAYRKSHRWERAVSWVRKTARRCERKIAGNWFYRILGLLGTGWLLFELGKLLLHWIQG